MHDIDLARRLMREHAQRVRFRPFAADAGVMSLAQAYEVQRRYVQLQRLDRSTAMSGYKIGLTSPGMQAMCGIATPIAGVVLADRVHRSGVVLDRTRFGRLGIEFEIAVRIGREVALVAGALPGIDEIAEAVDAVAAAIEVVDDRNCDYKTLDVLSLVSDNAWNAGIVLGDFRAAWPSLVDVEGAVYVDGADEPISRGAARDVMGHPFAAVAWLASHLAARGERLHAGDIVMTGSMVTTKFPGAPGQ
jgi:2-keto-4-pentenoate hydratase